MEIKIPRIVTDNSLVKNIGTNKKVSDMNKENEQLFRYAGIEAYDLYCEGELTHEKLVPFFEKIRILSDEIKALEGKNDNVCECGTILRDDMIFCPGCGKKLVVKNTVSVNSDQTGREVVKKTKECICGAEIPEGQTMCMECGRKINW